MLFAISYIKILKIRFVYITLHHIEIMKSHIITVFSKHEDRLFFMKYAEINWEILLFVLLKSEICLLLYQI